MFFCLSDHNTAYFLEFIGVIKICVIYLFQQNTHMDY